MSAKIGGTLPGGDGNGLEAIVADLCETPKKLHVAVVILDGKKVTKDADSGETIPTARIRRIEVIQTDDDRRVCEQLMRRALDTRMGRETLPYDLEQEIQGAFDLVDMNAPLEEEDEEDDDDDNG